MANIFGIDVSHYDGKFPWSKAPAAGVSFGFAKASEGWDSIKPQFTDKTFPVNWQAMKDNGIIRGAFHFIAPPASLDPTTWSDSIHRQIDHFLTVLGPLLPGDLPPSIDLEPGVYGAQWKAMFSPNTTPAVDYLRELIEYATLQMKPVVPILYNGFLNTVLKHQIPGVLPFSNYPLWMAEYRSVHTPALTLPKSCQDPKNKIYDDGGQCSSFDEFTAKLSNKSPKGIPAIWKTWAIWQFSEYGRIPPLSSGCLDLDVFNGTLSDLKALTIQPSSI